MIYRTPADIVEREHVRIRAAVLWALRAFDLGLLGLGVGFLGYYLNNRPVRLIGFGMGAAAVLLGGLTVLRILWIYTSGLRR